MAEILHVILKKIFPELDGKIPAKMLRRLSFNFHPKKTLKIPLFGPLKMAITKKTYVRSG
jgi:hypothetical protein